jgi:trimethylamine---corrinoid protein Co-methyltransferase
MASEIAPVEQARPSRSVRLGRSGRLQARGHVPSPVQPGLAGGQYLPLRASDLLQIHTTALRVLSEIGMGEATPEILEIALPMGCTLGEDGRLRFRHR